MSTKNVEKIKLHSSITTLIPRITKIFFKKGLFSAVLTLDVLVDLAGLGLSVSCKVASLAKNDPFGCFSNSFTAPLLASLGELPTSNAICCCSLSIVVLLASSADATGCPAAFAPAADDSSSRNSWFN